MGVVTSIKRTVLATAAVAVVVYAGTYLFTKTDTSGDRKATVIVKLGHDRDGRQVRGSVYTYINTAERSADLISDQKPNFSETFWLRPGEKVRLWSHLYFGKGSFSCQILLDGVPTSPPVVTPKDFEVSCEVVAVA